jgi:hypothetical protein
LKKTRIFHFQGLSALNMQCFFGFVSNFEHVNIAINGKYSKKNNDNSNYYASFVIFQTYKNVVWRNVHSLGWLLWLCFYPRLNVRALQITSTTLLIGHWKFWVAYKHKWELARWCLCQCPWIHENVRWDDGRKWWINW